MKQLATIIRIHTEGTAAKLGIDTRDDTGAMSMQWAAVAAIMIFIAIAVGAIMMAKAQSQANNIPDVVNTP